MAVTYKSLDLNDQITATTTTVDTLFTSSSGVTQINTATAYNNSGSSVTLFCYILAAGVAASTVDPIWRLDIPANSSAILTGLIGHVVPNLGSLGAYAGTTNVIRVSISGIEIVN